MTTASTALVPPIDNPALAAALRARLLRLRGPHGTLGRLDALAEHLGLVKNSETPRFQPPSIVVFAADHGLAVDQLCDPGGLSTVELVTALRADPSPLPLALLAQSHGLGLTVVDSGMADMVAAGPRLLARKIGHGSRNARAGSAMSVEQVHAGLRAGMEIADAVEGDAVACCGAGVGSTESAALVLAQISNRELADFVDTPAPATPEFVAHRMRVLDGARQRHGHLDNEIEILAAMGGFETAMMAGFMLAAAARRRLIVADGIAACASLLVAASIAPAVVDYCIHSRSHPHPGLTSALDLFGATALHEEGLDGIDGTGIALAWPRVVSAAGLLTDVTPASGSRPAGLVARPTSPRLLAQS